MLITILIAAVLQDTAAPHPHVLRPSRLTPCREPDGRIRLACLPTGTVRAMPSGTTTEKENPGVCASPSKRSLRSDLSIRENMKTGPCVAHDHKPAPSE